jgi:hypothetical protein
MRPFSILALAALCVSSGAAAQPERPYRPSAPTIVATPLALAIVGFDRDGDLQVSRPEYDWGVSKSFAGFDRDSDGFLSLIERTPWSEVTLGNAGALPGRFEFDRDGDDKIVRAEFVALFAARFVDLDKNRDATLSRSELVALVDSPLSRRDRRRAERVTRPQ